ncbi:MAG TPA: HDOD domain-containing protein [Verrucomicrobiae bacterium]|nr:HDOD domain-containing protein [Verrucomicrobiae bacterium]
MSAVNTDIRKRIETFEAMPALCAFLVEHLHDPTVDLQYLADQLRYDPGMTTNVLKVANSAMYGGREPLTSVQGAIARLGMKQLFQMVVAVGISKTLKKRLFGYQLEPAELLEHSVYVAVASEEIAKTLGMHTSEMLFTAGLLHDVGKILLDDYVCKEWATLSARFRSTTGGFDSVERETLGICHAEAGAALLRKWKFPEELVMAVRWHHQPWEAGDWTPMVNVVHIADILSYSEGIGTGVDGMRYKISRDAISSLGLRSKTIEAVASHSLDKVRELSEILSNAQTAPPSKPASATRRKDDPRT